MLTQEQNARHIGVEKQKRRNKEAVMEREERIDKEFLRLEMVRASHATFRGKFEECLEDHYPYFGCCRLSFAQFSCSGKKIFA